MEHAVAHSERDVSSVALVTDFRGNQLDLAQHLIGGMLAYQCCYNIRILFLVVKPKHDAPMLVWLAEAFSKQPCYLAILTHAIPSFSLLRRIEWHGQHRFSLRYLLLSDSSIFVEPAFPARPISG